MQPSGVHTFKLQSHPQAPSPEVHSLNVRIECTPDAPLRLRFMLEAHVSRLRIPAAAAPSRTDELWRHTCFEAFISAGDGSAYYELNLSPSSQWALYRFDSYRAGMGEAAISTPPAIAVRSSDFRLELDAALPLEELATLQAHSSLRLGLAAVIEAQDGRLSYWALRHPGEKPDFHQADGFVSVSR